MGRNGEYVLILGGGKLLRWRPDNTACSEYLEFTETVLRESYEAKYSASSLSDSARRTYFILEVFLTSPDTGLIMLLTYALCFALCYPIMLTDTNWIVPVLFMTSPTIVMVCVIVLTTALQWIVPQLGSDWEDLGLLLVWSQRYTTAHQIERIILEYMVAHLGPVSFSKRVLRQVNRILRTGRFNPIVNDLLPLLPVAGDNQTLRELLKLQAVCKQKGAGSLLSEDDLSVCIDRLKARLEH